MDRWQKLWEYAEDERVTITTHDTPEVVTLAYPGGETATLVWNGCEWYGREDNTRAARPE